MLERPKPGQTEEDLLDLQDNFYENKAASKIQLAANLVLDFQRDEQFRLKKLAFEERFRWISFKRPPVYKYACQIEGFLEIKRRELTLATGGGNLYSRHMRLEYDANEPSTSNGTEWAGYEQKKRKIVMYQPGSSSDISKFDRIQIHRENMDLLNQMSEQQIMVEKDEIIKFIDSDTLAYLKSKTSERMDLFPPLISKTQPELDKWLQFDVPSTENLDWLIIVELPKITLECQYDIRFDLDGWLMPATTDSINDRNREFYHHDGEQARPSFNKLQIFHMCSSAVEMEKLIGLTVVGNIAGLQSTGIYDNLIELPMEQFYFSMILSLNDTSFTILALGIKAIANLIYHPIDEACLDGLWSFGMGIPQPILAIDEKDDDKTISDQQLAETNLIKCLMRTNILTRIKEIVNAADCCMSAVSDCMNILTRLARDSNYVMMQVFQCEDLIQSIVTHFAPDVTYTRNLLKSHGIPITHALKFFRVLSARSSRIAVEMITKYKLLDPLLSYILNESFIHNTDGLRLQIEAFRLWTTFLRYGLTIERFKAFHHVIWTILNHHLKCTDLLSPITTQTHLSALLILISEVVKHDFEATKVYYMLLLDLGITKWFTQLMMMRDFSIGRLQIVSSLYVAMTNFIVHKPSSARISLDMLIKITEKMIDSLAFQRITADIILGSNLLYKCVTHKYGPNFKYTQAAVWFSSDHVVPILKTKSAIPFLRALADFAETTDNTTLMLKVIFHENIIFYLREMQMSWNYYLTNNWYTRVETALLINCMKMSVYVCQAMHTEIFYEIAIKTLTFYHEEQKPNLEIVMKSIVFSPEYNSLNSFIGRLNIVDETDISKDMMLASLQNIDDIFGVYMNVLGLKNLKVNPLRQSVSMNVGNAIQLNWIFTPIKLMYDYLQENVTDISEEDKLYTITNCLRWVNIFDKFFTYLSELIDTTERFCRLACVFLFSDTLYMEAEVYNLLDHCLKAVLWCEDNLNFEKFIDGIYNFQYFYPKLLKHYQSVSYGDVVFGNFILIPLAQRHNVKYRNIMWFEFPEIVQLCRLTEKDIYLPIESFLEPLEINVSLLHCYQKALKYGKLKPQSIFYKIAYHHVHKVPKKQFYV